MKKLTAEKCRERIAELESIRERGDLYKGGEISLQGLKIALPILEQQESEGTTNE